MADKITLGSIASFQNDTTAVAQYNANNALITAAFDNTLSRDGTSPNQMNSALDLNGNTLLNGTTSGLIAANIPFTPIGGITSNNVQAMGAELDTKKAAISNLSSVAFSGASTDLIGNIITWTPTLTCVTPGDLNIVYSTRLGYYTILGNHSVHVHFEMTTSTFTYTTAAGNVQIQGFPFTVASGPVVLGPLNFGGINKAGGYTQLYFGTGLGGGVSNFNMKASGMNLANAPVVITDMPSAGTVLLQGDCVVFI